LETRPPCGMGAWKEELVWQGARIEQAVVTGRAAHDLSKRTDEVLAVASADLGRARAACSLLASAKDHMAPAQQQGLRPSKNMCSVRRADASAPNCALGRHRPEFRRLAGCRSVRHSSAPLPSARRIRRRDRAAPSARRPALISPVRVEGHELARTSPPCREQREWKAMKSRSKSPGDRTKKGSGPCRGDTTAAWW